MLNKYFFHRWRHSTHLYIGVLLAGIAGLCAIGASTVVSAAALPDASKAGGAQAGSRYKAPVPPNMRRFLAKPESEAPPEKIQEETQIEVMAIQIDGVVDRPDHDITLSELNAFVEQLRQRFLAQSNTETKVDEKSPLSQEERNKLLKQLENAPKGEDSEATLEELEQTIQAFREKDKPPNVLTLQQLQEIAAHVAQYYQERGFILVRALIPPQTIVDGRVHIRVLEGILGNVTIEKNQQYNREQMLRPFIDLLAQPVTKDAIEEAMLLLNDYPGLQTFAVFRPGLHPGETDLLVSVLEENALDAKVHMDNYGSEYTGEYRSRVDMRWNNPSDAIDSLSLSFSKTFEPANGTYAALGYERSAFGPKNLFGIGISQNTYKLGSVLEPFDMEGTTTIAHTYWRRAFHRSRLFNSYALLQLDRKSSKLEVGQGDDGEDELTVFSVEGGFDWSSGSRRHMLNTNIQYRQGFEDLMGSMVATDNPFLTEASRRGGSGMYAGSEFTKVNLSYDHWYSMAPRHILHVSFRGQHSEDLLVSLEQMAIGGPNSVRAYSAAEFLRDKAVSTSVEWLMRAPGFSEWKAFGNKRWGEVLQVSLFADYAKGWLNDPLASDREVVSLSGVGAGLRFNYGEFSASFEIASPLGDEVASNQRDPQYFFEINYGF